MPWQRSFRRQNTSVVRYIFTGTCSPLFQGNIRVRCQGCSRRSMHRRARKAARKKAKDVVEQFRAMKLKEAAKKLEDGIEETLIYMDFPSQHWLKIRTNNVIERMNREIRRRTRVVGTFPDGRSALMLVCARLRYVSGKEWGSKRYLCMKYLTTGELA